MPSDIPPDGPTSTSSAAPRGPRGKHIAARVVTWCVGLGMTAAMAVIVCRGVGAEAHQRTLPYPSPMATNLPARPLSSIRHRMASRKPEVSRGWPLEWQRSATTSTINSSRENIKHELRHTAPLSLAADLAIAALIVATSVWMANRLGWRISCRQFSIADALAAFLIVSGLCGYWRYHDKIAKREAAVLASTFPRRAAMFHTSLGPSHSGYRGPQWLIRLLGAEVYGTELEKAFGLQGENDYEWLTGQSGLMSFVWHVDWVAVDTSANGVEQRAALGELPYLEGVRLDLRQDALFDRANTVATLRAIPGLREIYNPSIRLDRDDYAALLEIEQVQTLSIDHPGRGLYRDDVEWLRDTFPEKVILCPDHPLVLPSRPSPPMSEVEEKAFLQKLREMRDSLERDGRPGASRGR